MMPQQKLSRGAVSWVESGRYKLCFVLIYVEVLFQHLIKISVPIVPMDVISISCLRSVACHLLLTKLAIHF